MVLSTSFCRRSQLSGFVHCASRCRPPAWRASVLAPMSSRQEDQALLRAMGASLKESRACRRKGICASARQTRPAPRQRSLRSWCCRYHVQLLAKVHFVVSRLCWRYPVTRLSRSETSLGCEEEERPRAREFAVDDQRDAPVVSWIKRKRRSSLTSVKNKKKRKAKNQRVCGVGAKQRSSRWRCLDGVVCGCCERYARRDQVRKAAQLLYGETRGRRDERQASEVDLRKQSGSLVQRRR